MNTWALHYLNSRGALDAYKTRIDAALREVARRAERVSAPLILDIVVRAVRNGGIPEIGHVGHVAGPGLLMVTIDPDNPNLSDNMGEPLERMIAHELHHLMRFDAIGYGSTLGDALVSEGLACHFVRELYANDREPWERALPREELGQYARLARSMADRTDYSYVAWFFGEGDLPRWLGYTLGWEIVSDFLRENPDARPSGLAATPPEPFLPFLDSLAAD